MAQRDKASQDLLLSVAIGTEWFAAIVVTLLSLGLCLVHVTHAGPLWRDESGVLQIAAMPRLSDVFANFHHEAFPPPFHLLVRGYVAIAGGSDSAIRALGFMFAVSLLGAAWWNGLKLRRRAPLLVLSFIGLNSVFLTWGPLLRGYALGSALLILTFGFFTQWVAKPSRSTFVAAAIGATATVQTMIQSVPLLAAMSLAAAITLAIARRGKAAALSLAIGAVAGISLLPYAKNYAAAADWSVVLQRPIDAMAILGWLKFALGKPLSITGTAWLMALAMAVGATGWLIRRERSVAASPLFPAFVAALSAGAYFVFLVRLQYVTPWYFLPPLVCVAAALEHLIANVRSIALTIMLLTLAVVTAVAVPSAVWPSLIQRRTNIDLIATKLENTAGRNDLIVVTPFYFGVSFNHYYHGPARWLTIPPVSEHRFHSYDQVKLRMTMSDPLFELREAISETLRAGNRVWLLGTVEMPRPGDEPLQISPAPDPVHGWHDDAYMHAWAQQISVFLIGHATGGSVVEAPMPNVDSSENVRLLMVNGWRD